MEVRRISLDDAISLESRDSSTALRVNIFTSEAIQCCRLSCRALLASNEASMLNLKARKAAKVTKPIAPDTSSSFTLQDLKESAGQGCTACGLFECLFRELLASLGCINTETAVLMWLTFSKFKILLHFGAVQRRVQLFCIIGSNTKLAFMRPTKVLAGDTSSDISMQRACRMIEKCEQQHASCRPGREELLPKRLVDLSPTEHREDHVRLVEFAENAEARGTYACLSHCWGQDPMPITTTQKTILENKRSMSLSRLPPTFRDAVLIARKLNLRYIWIDSLCIVQDSRSDWEAESAKMASIYKNAFITIAATASPDFQGGCFSKSDADLCFQVKQSGVFDTVIAARMEVMGELPELYPLLTRGWVYQERMLSRRYLHCYRNELMLECREQRICECGNHPGRDRYGEQLAAKSKYHDPGRNRLASSWQKVVMNYSMLRLTKPSDKLPAIFGCAQDMGDPNRGRYLAGVWERTLGEDLLWIPRNYSTVSRPTKWRAPSWTWASIDTPDGVKFLAGGVGDAASGATTSLKAFQTQIKEARCDAKDPNSPFDLDPAAAYLQLECKLIKAHIRRLCYSCRKAMTVDHWVMPTPSHVPATWLITDT
ncbi:heterokaryon incompatibility protein-domain-containing protein [Xylaria bambusicola]|uniref:heterokaryon incompatibility protein-domain-containing protein n=1 Tax=Xylaria bambusicola TaxID=326684 RepID=UPI00200821A0|nr:heterokaryon incompatibility protein-domain-containing protein [Xylaria bambusicola]KAI0505267.1 heterokaryon incompatibility protein-domain-containing protein [Xylaria bambusicola]